MNTVLRAISIRSKLMLTGIILLIPLLVIVQMLVSEKNEAIELVKKELIGLDYLDAVRPLLEHLPEHRGLVHGYLNSEKDFKEAIVVKAAQVDEAIRKLDAADLILGDRLQTTEKWRLLEKEWSDLKMRALTLSVEESFKRHTMLISRLIELISHVGNTSNLVLDTDVDTYYLMDAVVVKLPYLTELVGHSQGFGLGIAVRKQFSKEDEVSMLLLNGRIDQLLLGLSSGMETAFEYTPSIRSKLEVMLKSGISDVHLFHKEFESPTESGKGFLPNPMSYFDAGVKANQSLFVLYDQIQPVLRSLLHVRTERLVSDRTTALTIILVFFVVTLGLGITTIRTITAPLAEVTDAVKRIINGDYSSEISSNGKDEIGDLAKFAAAMMSQLKAREVNNAKIARAFSIVENTLDNIMFADNDLILTYMNPSSIKTFKKHAHLFPCSYEKMIGQPLDIFHQDHEGIKAFLLDEKNLPHTATITLGDEIFEQTSMAIYNHLDERIGTMVNWLVITEKTHRQNSLTETAAMVTSSSEDLSQASQDMRMNAEKTTQEAETVASISNETNTSVQSVASAAEEMSVTVKEISKSVQDASMISQKAVSKAEHMNETIGRLDGSSAEIGKVVKVISSIAGQTNLLALNATIEAARAGKAGKGFAVVANEVKQLAKETAEATEEIRDQITTIQDNTQGAVDAIKDITEIIKQNNEIALTIAAAMEEQAVTTDDITQSMVKAAHGTEEVEKQITYILSAALASSKGADNIEASSKQFALMADRFVGLTNNDASKEQDEDQLESQTEGQIESLTGDIELF